MGCATRSLSSGHAVFAAGGRSWCKPSTAALRAHLGVESTCGGWLCRCRRVLAALDGPQMRRRPSRSLVVVRSAAGAVVGLVVGRAPRALMWSLVSRWLGSGLCLGRWQCRCRHVLAALGGPWAHRRPRREVAAVPAAAGIVVGLVVVQAPPWLCGRVVFSLICGWLGPGLCLGRWQCRCRRVLAALGATWWAGRWWANSA